MMKAAENNPRPTFEDDIDPITFEVLRNTFEYVCKRMNSFCNGRHSHRSCPKTWIFRMRFMTLI